MSSFVLKEKLKLLKKDLKTWNLECFGRMDKNNGEKIERIRKLDVVDEAFGLTVEEVIEQNKLRALLCRDYLNKDSLLKQKARCKWIKEGDVNSSFFS